MNRTGRKDTSASERKRKERTERMRNAHSVQRAIEFLDSMVIVSEMNQTNKALPFPFTVHTFTYTNMQLLEKLAAKFRKYLKILHVYRILLLLNIWHFDGGLLQITWMCLTMILWKLEQIKVVSLYALEVIFSRIVISTSCTFMSLYPTLAEIVLILEY